MKILSWQETLFQTNFLLIFGAFKAGRRELWLLRTTNYLVGQEWGTGKYSIMALKPSVQSHDPSSCDVQAFRFGQDSYATVLKPSRARVAIQGQPSPHINKTSRKLLLFFFQTTFYFFPSLTAFVGFGSTLDYITRHSSVSTLLSTPFLPF